MTNDADAAIPPALTPEQWRDAFREVPGTLGPGYAVTDGGTWQYTMRGFDTGEVSIEAPDGRDADIGSRHLPALIALANAALPENDPHKLTRDDVSLLESARQDLAGKVADDVRALAAKLAALLPP